MGKQSLNTESSVKFIDEMNVFMFEDLLANSSKKAVNTSIKKLETILPIALNEKVTDKRARQLIYKDYMRSSIRNKESILTTKIVSLYLLFANPVDQPTYFEDLCELFNIERVAGEYQTTVDNVKSYNILKKYVEKLNETKKAKTK